MSETAFKDGIIFSGRIARFFLDQVAALRAENKALRDENLHLKNELLDYRHAKVKSDHLEAENRSMSEQLSRLQVQGHFWSIFDEAFWSISGPFQVYF